LLNLRYLGRPIQAFDSNDKLVWSAEYDIYGKIKMLVGNKRSIPFRQLGQYEDSETELYYNRYRYYDYNTGAYISKDPIGLEGNNSNLYAYVHDTNKEKEIDIFGLTGNPLIGLDLNNMNRQQISAALDGSDNITYKGGSPDGKFMQWEYSDTGRTAVRIDPPDKVTKYDHIHLFDDKGNPLDINGNIVDRTSPDAHIQIKCT